MADKYTKSDKTHFDFGKMAGKVKDTSFYSTWKEFSNSLTVDKEVFESYAKKWMLVPSSLNETSTCKKHHKEKEEFYPEKIFIQGDYGDQALEILNSGKEKCTNPKKKGFDQKDLIGIWVDEVIDDPSTLNKQKGLIMEKEELKQSEKTFEEVNEVIEQAAMELGISPKAQMGASAPKGKKAVTAIQKQADRLHQARMNIKNGLANASKGYLNVGKWLMIVRHEGLWKLEQTVTTFDQWVETEVGIGKSAAYHAIGVYEKFGDLLENSNEFVGLDFYKVVALLPYVPQKATVQQKEDLLHMAKTSTVKGLANNLKEMKGGTATDACEHLETELVTFQKCKVCGKLIKQ